MASILRYILNDIRKKVKERRKIEKLNLHR